MTEILVRSIEDEDTVVQPLHRRGSGSSIQMQGFAADQTLLLGETGSTNTATDDRFQHSYQSAAASGWERGRERAHSRASQPTSVRSEPDLDTIMPLPGSAFTRNGGGYHRLPGEGSDTDSECANSPASFTAVEHPMMGHSVFGDDLTAKALETCKRTVLHPYLVFLKVIGWRRFNPKRYDLRTPVWLTVLNVLWPTFACLLLVLSCVTQICTCFRRDSVPLSPRNTSQADTLYTVNCDQHILTTFIIPDLLLISAFAYGLYIFRWVHIEQLATLTEAVFLGHITRHGRYTHKRLTRSLQLLMALGVCWIVFSMVTSIGRAYTLHLVDKKTKIQWLSGNSKTDYGIRWTFVSITMVGFVVQDIAYTVLVVNYCIQCQLIIYLVRSICERTKTKEWDIEKAIKEIRNSCEFLTQLNSHLSRAISILLFIFITLSLTAIYSLQKDYTDDSNGHLSTALGVLGAVQWISILVMPLIQAARVTQSCSHLKKTATEIRSRPYSYKDTSQLDLDSMVIFTSGLSMSAKLISIPITPALVVGTFFVTGLVLFLVFQFNGYAWAKWL